jgi:adenine modification enzyme
MDLKCSEEKGRAYGIAQDTLFGHATPESYGSEEFRVSIIPRDAANDMVIANHYSGKVFPLSEEHHGVYIFGELSGVLQWGPGMNPASGGSVVKGTKSGEWLELNRMWLSDDAPRNSESKAVAYSVKLIRKRRPNVKWLQSFADERCGGLGVVYQACSFDYLGEHTSIFWELDGEWFHNIAATVRGDELGKRKGAAYLQANIGRAEKHELRQFRYWRGLSKSAHKNLILKKQAYPKRPVNA